MSKNRYFVDERTGCIAVRDHKNTDPEYPGLHPDTPGVVKYWSGHPAFETCPLCKDRRQVGYEVDETARTQAREYCNKLNADTEDSHSPTAADGGEE